MAAILYYLMGNSDVALEGETRFATDFRSVTREIYEEISERNSTKGRIQFRPTGFILKEPIEIELNAKAKMIQKIEFPIFTRLWEKLDPEPQLIVWFATDQESGFPSDTVWAQKLLQLFIERKYTCEQRLNIIDQDPSDYDHMAEYFTTYFQNNRELLNSSLPAYFCLSSGTPAMITNFALGTLDQDFHYFYVGRNGIEPQEVKTWARFNRERYGHILHLLLDNYHYEAALKLVQLSPFKGDHKLLALLEACQRRFLFDFTGCWAIIKNRVPEYSSLFDQISSINLHNDKAFIREMAARVEMAFNAGELHTGIAFLFNLLENVRDDLIRQFAGISIEKVDNGFPEWENFIKTTDVLSDKEKQELLQRPEPNRKTKLRVLKKIAKKRPNETITQSIDFLDRFETTYETPWGKKMCLQDLRNLGPLAHGQQGIDKAIVKMMWPPYGIEQLINDLKFNLMSIYGFEELSNPFDDLNRELEKLKNAHT